MLKDYSPQNSRTTVPAWYTQTSEKIFHPNLHAPRSPPLGDGGLPHLRRLLKSIPYLKQQSFTPRPAIK